MKSSILGILIIALIISSNLNLWSQCPIVDNSAGLVNHQTSNPGLPPLPSAIGGLGQTFEIVCSGITGGTLDKITVYRDHLASIPGTILGIDYELSGGTLASPVVGVIDLVAGLNTINFTGVNLDVGTNMFEIKFSHLTTIFDLDDTGTVGAEGTYLGGTAIIVFGAATFPFPGTDLRFKVDFTAILPVELLSFTAQPTNNNEVALQWKTASETNNDGFDVERSTDGKTWEQITFIPGYGTTTDVKTYSFLDTKPSSSLNYYRLKQMDFDGAFEYSDIVSVRFDNGGELTLYPNPTSGKVTLVGADFKNAQLDIYDALGSLVRKQIFSGQELDMTDLAEGLYYLTIQNDQETFQLKVFKK